MPILLTEADVKRLLPMSDLIDAMEAALAQFSTGGVVQPLRTVLQVGAEKAFFGVMPAYITSPPALGTKLVTVFNSNAARNLPTHLATILLLDPDTGGLLALLDGRYITEARTAAVSAVSARYLANPGAHNLAILGSGVQARSHLEALAHAFGLRRVRVWSPDRQRRESFASEMSKRLQRVEGAVGNVESVESAVAAVSGADLIVVATAAVAPVIHGSWVTEGAHVMAVGACRPDQRELDSDLIARARIYVDSRTGALAEAGDLVLPIAAGRIGPDHIVGELGELVAGRCAGRGAPSEVTLFKSLGMAVEDVAAAQLAYRRAVAEGIGQPLNL